MSQLPRIFRILLLVSLALNIGLGAALISLHLHARDANGAAEGKRWARIPDPRALARVLGEPDRVVLREVIGNHHQQLREHFRPLGRARRELSTVLRQEPFDMAALEQAFAKVRVSETETAEAMHRFMLELAPKLSPEGRQRIAALLEKRHQHRRDRRREREDAEAPPAEKGE